MAIRSDKSRVRSQIAICLLVVLGAFAAVKPAEGEAAGVNVCDALSVLGTLGEGTTPGACWRPYGDSSPFNRTIPGGAPSAPHSSGIVRRLLSGGRINDLVVGDPARDGGNSTFYSKVTDPLYTLRCVKPWGHCMIEGMQIHVPAAARPTGGFATPGNDHDAHMTIVDQVSGWEYDLWNVNSKPDLGGDLKFGWGGRTRIDGDGLGSDAVAARYGNLAGPIRIEELRAGAINHALAMDVPCTETYVYPAVQTGQTCTGVGESGTDSPPMGAHFQLNMSMAQIDALGLPGWKRTILVALAKYGAYTSDTTTADDQWGFEMESGNTYTSFGLADPWVTYARQLGISGEDFNQNGAKEYWMDLASGVPWDKLRVVDVCAAQGTCAPAATTTTRHRQAGAHRIRYQRRTTISATARPKHARSN